jgi:isopenicillin N synthase-like dioxygenase
MQISGPPLDQALCRALREFGFVKLRGHDIDASVTRPAYAAVRAFFGLSREQKRRYHVPGTGGARGYTPYRIETAKDATDPDLKEFFHVGREPDPRHPATPANLWPEEVPEFKAALQTLFAALETLGARVLAGLARELSLPETWFIDKIDHGSSILRPLHYPPLPAHAPAGVRSAAHEDINLITLLIASGEPGLELCTQDGRWLDLAVEPGEIVVNIGDMLQRLSNHVFVSTTHRVVNPPEPFRSQPRYSIPFFLHPNPEFVIETLPSCISFDRPNRYPQPITAQAYLAQRLREIGLM